MRTTLINYRYFDTVGLLIRNYSNNPQPLHLEQFSKDLRDDYNKMSDVLAEIDCKSPGDAQFDDMRRDHRRAAYRLAIANQLLKIHYATNGPIRKRANMPMRQWLGCYHKPGGRA